MRRFVIRLLNLLLKVLWVFPINPNKVFCLNFNGDIVGHDAKAFVEWCRENKKELEFVWGYTDRNVQYDAVRTVRTKSFRGFYELLTSKAIVYNIDVPSYVPFRKQQVLVNTWHGYPFKKVGKYVLPLNITSFSKASAFISHGKEYTSFCLHESFVFTGDILDCGAPRNDIFFSKKSEEARCFVRDKYFIGNNKIVLYVPTFRDGYEKTETQIDFARLTNVLEKRFGDTWVVLAKVHPSRMNSSNFDAEKVIDASKHHDTQELLCAADVLITDYSSAMWDFSLQRKPVFIYAEDVEWYSENRGFYKPIEEWPYSVSRSNEELENNILKFELDKYVEMINIYYSKIGCYDCGMACESVYEYIFGKA